MSWIADPAFATGPSRSARKRFPTASSTRATGRGSRSGSATTRCRSRRSPTSWATLADLVSGTSLDPLLAATRVEWSELRARLIDLVTGSGTPPGASLRAADRRACAAAVHGRRLRGLLLLALPRGERRPDHAAGLRAAAAELDAPAGRLPRPRPARSSSRAPTSCARTASARARRCRSSARPAGWTSRPRSASCAAARSRAGCRPRTRRSTSSAWCWSTTGPRATSRAGSTSRSARSWASRSRRRCRRG